VNAAAHHPDTAKVAVHGGAIALGRPVGATGASLITPALHEMNRSDAASARQPSGWNRDRGGLSGEVTENPPRKRMRRASGRIWPHQPRAERSPPRRSGAVSRDVRARPTATFGRGRPRRLVQGRDNPRATHPNGVR
jgi:thiolase-like protein